MTEHFGVKLLKPKEELKLTRENYASITDNKSSFFKNEIHSDATCKEFYDEGMINFDNNIRYFMAIDKDKFHTTINLYIKTHDVFHEIFDISGYSEKSGYYILVLDAYCQAYVGQTSDIKKRIPEHWRKKMPLDRLIFSGGIEGSKISIDSFRALDTTRIFVCETKDYFRQEHKFITEFPSEYRLNRVGGTLRNE